MGRRFAAPDDKLECRIKPLAFRQGDIDQILDLLGTRPRNTAQQDRVTKGRRIVLGREIEMSEPQPLVGECEELVGTYKAAV